MPFEVREKEEKRFDDKALTLTNVTVNFYTFLICNKLRICHLFNFLCILENAFFLFEKTILQMFRRDKFVFIY